MDINRASILEPPSKREGLPVLLNKTYALFTLVFDTERTGKAMETLRWGRLDELISAVDKYQVILH